MFGRDPAAILLADERPIGDAQQGVVGAPHPRLGEVDIVGGHEGRVTVVGEGHQPRLGRGFAGESVALQLDIESVAEDPDHLFERCAGLAIAAGDEQRVDGTVRTAREGYEAPGSRADFAPGHVRLRRRLDVEEGGRRQLAEVAISHVILSQQDDGGSPGPSFGRRATQPRHRQGASDDRLDTTLAGDHRELECAKEIGPVGERHRRHPRVARETHDRVRLDGSLKERIGGPHPQVDESLRPIPILRRHTPTPKQADPSRPPPEV